MACLPGSRSVRRGIAAFGRHDLPLLLVVAGVTLLCTALKNISKAHTCQGKPSPTQLSHKVSWGKQSGLQHSMQLSQAPSHCQPSRPQAGPTATALTQVAENTAVSAMKSATIAESYHSPK